MPLQMPPALVVWKSAPGWIQLREGDVGGVVAAVAGLGGVTDRRRGERAEADGLAGAVAVTVDVLVERVAGAGRALRGGDAQLGIGQQAAASRCRCGLRRRRGCTRCRRQRRPGAAPATPPLPPAPAAPPLPEPPPDAPVPAVPPLADAPASPPVRRPASPATGKPALPAPGGRRLVRRGRRQHRLRLQRRHHGRRPPYRRSPRRRCPPPTGVACVMGATLLAASRSSPEPNRTSPPSRLGASCRASSKHVFGGGPRRVACEQRAGRGEAGYNGALPRP